MSYLKIKDRKQIDTIIKAKQDECKAINDQLLPLKESLLKKRIILEKKLEISTMNSQRTDVDSIISI